MKLISRSLIIHLKISKIPTSEIEHGIYIETFVITGQKYPDTG
jgi:hypothetical protein